MNNEERKLKGLALAMDTALDKVSRKEKMAPNNKRYDEDGCRLTDCCGAYSTYMDLGLSCRACCKEVEIGEGDGCENK